MISKAVEIKLFLLRVVTKVVSSPQFCRIFRMLAAVYFMVNNEFHLTGRG